MWKYFCLSLLLNLKMKECQEVFSFELWWYMNSEQTRKQIHGCQIWSFPLREKLIHYNDKLDQITIYKANTRNSNTLLFVSLFLYHFSITKLVLFSIMFIFFKITTYIENWKIYFELWTIQLWPRIFICSATITRVIE